jgi:hypothetical protein
MIAPRRVARLAYSALVSIAIAVSCAKAEDSPLADRGGTDDDGGDSGGGKGGTSAQGGTAGSTSTGGSAGGGGTTTGGTAGKGGSTSTGGKGGTTSTGGSGGSTIYGCLDGEGGAGGASGGATGEAGAGGRGTQTLFFDDFEDGDENGWTSTSGTWSIVEDDTTAIEQSQFDGNTLRVASVLNACWGDQIVEARVKVLDFGGNSTSYSANVFARYLDAETYYVLGINSGSNGQLFIGKQVGGGLERLASEGGYGFDDNEDVWFTLRLELIGSSLKAYLNDTLELETTDTQITSGGVAVGTTHASARFDDVRVTGP